MTEVDCIRIAIEQNQFQFGLDMLSVKKTLTEKKKRALSKIIEKSNAEVEGKWSRLVEEAKGICAYTGKSLVDSDIEYDHIIPQSECRRRFGAVINHELNLIAVSKIGNQKKGSNRYDLDNLDPSYLKRAVETTSKAEIIAKLKVYLGELLEARKEINVDYNQLPPEKKLLLKLGMFISRDDEPEIASAIARILNRLSASRVNGTQRWFLRLLTRELKKLYSDGRKIPRVRTYLVNAQEISFVRKALVDTQPELKKQDHQSEFSHVIDATVAATSILPGEWNQASIASVLPDQFSVEHLPRSDKPLRNPGSRQWFKAKPYAFRFLPMLIERDLGNLRAGFGFYKESIVELVGRDRKTDYAESLKAALATLWPYLNQNKNGIVAGLPDANELVNSLDRSVWLSFNRTRVQDFLFSARDDRSNNTIELVNFFRSISYTTQKKPVEDLVFLKENGKVKGVNSQASCVAEITRASYIKTGKIFFGQLKAPEQKQLLPTNRDWLQVSNALIPKLQEAFQRGEDLASSVKIADSEYLKLVPQYFTGTSLHSARSLRTKNRRVFSLPLVPTKSGPVFVVRRTDPKQNPVYQLGVVAGAQMKGFEKGTNHDMDFVPFDQLQSKKLLSLGKNRVGCSGSNTVYLGQFFPVKLDHIQELEGTKVGIAVSANSTVGVIIRVTAPYSWIQSKFGLLMPPNLDLNFSTVSSLVFHNFKNIKTADEWRGYLSEALIQYLPKPESSGTLLKATTEGCVFEYRTKTKPEKYFKENIWSRPAD